MDGRLFKVPDNSDCSPNIALSTNLSNSQPKSAVVPPQESSQAKVHCFEKCMSPPKFVVKQRSNTKVSSQAASTSSAENEMKKVEGTGSSQLAKSSGDQAKGKEEAEKQVDELKCEEMKVQEQSKKFPKTKPICPDFSVSLNLDEIEDDLRLMSLEKFCRIPQKSRPREVQRELNILSPGMLLHNITPMKYDVPKDRSRSRKL